MSEGVTCVQAGQHQTFHPESGIVLHLLHGGPAYQAFLLQVDAKTSYHSAPHDGEELRFVVSGEVIFDVHGKEYRVGAGGTLRHPSTVSHGFRTEGRPASFVTFALSRHYDVARLFEDGRAGGAAGGGGGAGGRAGAR